VTTATAIGERLMQLHKKRKLSMRELAERSGAGTSLISQVETGKTNPTLAKLENLAAALGVPVNYFFRSVRRATARSFAGRAGGGWP
jgi:transcriptional regulator with XRE-family HTH domain